MKANSHLIGTTGGIIINPRLVPFFLVRAVSEASEQGMLLSGSPYRSHQAAEISRFHKSSDVRTRASLTMDLPNSDYGI